MRIVILFKQFLKDVAEFRAATRPMPNPENMPESNFKKMLRLPRETKLKVMHESFALWKLQLKDRDKAILEITREREFLELAKAKSKSQGQDIQTVLKTSEELWKQVETLYPDKPVNNLGDVVDTVMGKKKEIKTFATSMMETSQQVLMTFMEGYRLGRDEARLKTINSEAQITDLPQILRSMTQPPVEGKEGEKEKEKK